MERKVQAKSSSFFQSKAQRIKFLSRPFFSSDCGAMGNTESCCSDKDEKKTVAEIEIVSAWPVTGEAEAVEFYMGRVFLFVFRLG